MTQATMVLPAQPQVLWKTPAVANFVLGGLGAGLYVAATVAAGFADSPALRLAAWLGPALVIGGFIAVATEAGRPLRCVRLFRNVRTSWMSREVAFGGAFVLLAMADGLAPSATFRTLATVAAAGFILAQGFILGSARAVVAWSVKTMPAVFFASGLISGAGLLLLVEVCAGRVPHTALLGAVLVSLLLGLLLWLGHLAASDEREVASVLAPLRRGAGSVSLVAFGYVLPFIADVLALALPELAPSLAATGAVLMIAGQARLKWALLREVATLRPITIPTSLLRRPS